MKIIGLVEIPIKKNFDNYVYGDILMIPIEQIPKSDYVYVYALFTKVSSRVDRNLIIQFPNLLLIGIPATGIDSVDVEYCEQQGIKILSLKDRKFAKKLHEFSSTSEIFFWHLLSLVRNCDIASRSVRSGFWDRNEFIGSNLRGLTLGILGFGRLGKQVANIGTSLGMKVIFFDKNNNLRSSLKHKRVRNLSELIKNTNILSINVDFSFENLNLIDNLILENITKKPFYLINTSRGAIVDELAILNGLKSGVIDGYGSDVLTGEVSERSNWLFESHIWQAYKSNKFKISLTPHIGGATYQNIETSEDFILSELVNMLRNIHEHTKK